MSLLESMMEECVFLNHSKVNDGYGGYTETWTDGATFDATIIKANSTEAIIAERQGVEEIYTVVIRKGFTLDFHDVFRRKSDNQVFRVTGMSADSEAPEASTVRIGKVTAEKWVIPA